MPLVLVTAAAGYGKTTVLRQWEAEDSRDFAWVDAQADASDPIACMAYLAQALQLLDARLLAGPLGDSTFWADVALPRFGEAVRHRAGPFVLVIDDIQRLGESSAWLVISAVLDNLPTGSQLVLSGRIEPVLPLGRHQAHRQLLWLRQADLSLSPVEGEALLRLLGVDLDMSDADKLLERVEGWPAGVCLAGLVSQGNRNARKAVASLEGSNPVVADHFRAEVLGSLSPDMVSFLTRTSILGTLSGEACDAALQRTDSGLMLDRASRANLMLVPIDRHQQKYRYHQLFAEALQAELVSTEPELAADLHRRASDFHARSGNVDEAIRHAQAAGDMRRSTQLVWTHLARYLAAGRCPDVERWLQGFTDAQLHRDASLSLAAAGCALMAGRNAEHWLRAAEECQRSAEPEWPDDLPSVPVAIGLLHGVLAKAGPVAMGADAERIYDIATTDDPSRALAAFLAGVSYSFTGDSATALKWLEEGEQLAALLGLPATRAACLGQRAILAFHSDDWARADALATRAVAIATQFGLENVKTMAPVYAASALSLAHRHRVDEAQRAARRARRMTAGIARGVDWQAHQCRILLARTYLLLEDAGNARLLVDEARKASGPGASDLRNDLDDVQRLTDAMPVAGQSGGAAITAAERRVLQLLRTHLSFSEIGDVLLRSRNTVKTQAISIYRKLDVGSRGEAVEQATKLGLN